MASVKLTDKYISNTTSNGQRQEIADGQQQGLYFIIQPSGSKSWAARFRYLGRTVKQTVGPYPEISLKEARDTVFEIRRVIAAGGNPLAEKQEADAKREENLIEVVFEEFLKRHVEKKNSASVAKRRRNVFHREIEPRWKGKLVQEIKRRDIIKLLEEIAERAPVMANRVHGFLRKFFNWCVDREYLEYSPMLRLKAPADEDSRDRILDNDELRLIWLGAERMGYPFGPIVQALILSGQRQQEVGAICRSELGGAREFGSNTPMWTIPKERTKNKKGEHIVPLTPMLDSLFNEQPLIIGDKGFIFTYTGKRAVTAYSHAKERLDEAILAIKREEAEARGEDVSQVKPVDHWTFHDLRRTAATGMAALKVDPHVIEAVLNHKSGNIKGIAAVYNRYQYFDEKYEALLKWEGVVKRIVAGESNVVHFKLNVVNDMAGNA